MSSAPTRRDAESQVASQARRGSRSSAPGSYRVQAARPSPTPDVAAGALAYYGQLRVGVGTLVGDFVGSSTVIVFEGAPTDDFQNGASGSYDGTTGKFTPGATGYWGLWVDLSVGSVTSSDFGYLEIEASSTGSIRVPFFHDGSTVLRAGIQAGPFKTAALDFFRVIAHVDSTFSGVVSGGQAVMWATGLY